MWAQHPDGPAPSAVQWRYKQGWRTSHAGRPSSLPFPACSSFRCRAGRQGLASLARTPSISCALLRRLAQRSRNPEGPARLRQHLGCPVRGNCPIRRHHRGAHHTQAWRHRLKLLLRNHSQGLEPVLATAVGRITITTNFERLPPGVHICQSSSIVPIAVRLAQPVGNRKPFHAICLDSLTLTMAFFFGEGTCWQPVAAPPANVWMCFSVNPVPLCRSGLSATRTLLR